MLIIRQEQMNVLTASRFEAWLVRHLNNHFPAHCRALGPDGFPRAVHDSLAAGRSFGFTGSELAQFVDLTFLFGENFSSKPQYEWAACILNDDVTTTPRQKMDRLYGAALDYLRSLAAVTSRR